MMRYIYAFAAQYNLVLLKSPQLLSGCQVKLFGKTVGLSWAACYGVPEMEPLRRYTADCIATLYDESIMEQD